MDVFNGLLDFEPDCPNSSSAMYLVIWKKKLVIDAVFLTKNMYVVAPLSFRMDAKRSFQSTLLNGEREMGYCYAREFCRVSASSISIGFGELWLNLLQWRRGAMVPKWKYISSWSHQQKRPGWHSMHTFQAPQQS